MLILNRYPLYYTIIVAQISLGYKFVLLALKCITLVIIQTSAIEVQYPETARYVRGFAKS